ncbi:alpha-(1-_3)-arabinofuranosyltransferase domain-containing protein [Actinomadura algeriensis]|uniref:Arabinofuranan 3-O-arabinosyltransferase n=1 Tax=Actinomadura algeriensis TaxID=1679523 RepID=A0ABR9JMJ0_9ACTN|nr:alpha-(1->3)-arabinofuranosyltransferase family protein [Actinomadura algeriensis]MBE1531345.1 arabinofuranan 3-O-arabinosyltransferase [Actinomadura algeriensis]
MDADAAAARLRDRLRAVACCCALIALAFGTRPGSILADTKIDMAVNPLGFLGGALHLWSPEQFGQLQNQAVGYLFPMGPFYALGDVAGVPAWITQRCWLALLMCLAFTGTLRLAGRLGVGGPRSRAFAAMAYALAPNALSTLGLISSEYMPVAMLPWIVLPLVSAIAGDTGRLRAAARSGLAIACCGGINATATLAVLVVPAIYLLTRPRGTLRFRLAAWWSAAVAAAIAWWLIPLTLTGTYGFSWLTYTEKASTTTGPTGLVNVLRGAERWVNYLVADGQIWSPVGYGLSLTPLAMLCTGVVAALGLAGLAGRLLPERTFLLLTLLTGLAILTTGHMSDLPGLFAGDARALLDGALAPFRNLHKFDAVIRLPLALGLAHVLVAAARWLKHRRPEDDPTLVYPERGGLRGRIRAAAVLPLVAAVALGGIGLTGAVRGLSGSGDFKEVPGYWKDAASWLNERAGRQGVLAVPGSAFGEYLWGRPMDDIVQPLLDARWGVRQLVPAGSPGYTRALDAIELQARAGQPSPGLSEFLGRMGVRYVLVRNDLRRESLDGGRPARVHETLDGSPGLKRVATFGPPVGHTPVDDAVSALDQPYPALEVYEVEGAEPVATLTEAADPVRVYGGPESLLTMADGGALPDGPVLLNDDAADLGGAPVITDSPRLVRRNFGELHQTSHTLGAAHRREAADVLDDGWKRYASHVAYGGGIRDVTASSAASGEDTAPEGHLPGAAPFAALDGDPFSAWRTGGFDGPVGQWLRVDFDRPRDVGDLTAAFLQAEALGPPVARVAVETEHGAVEQDVRRTADAQPLRAPEGETRWVRIRVLGLTAEPAEPGFARAGITELAVGGVEPTRTYVLPSPGGTDEPATYVMSRVPGGKAPCMRGSVRWVCSDELGVRGEEGDGFDRTFASAKARDVRLTGTAVLTDEELIARYTEADRQPVVKATSTLTAHPANAPRSGFDGDPATTWIAEPDDRAPAFAVAWGAPRKVGTLELRRPPGASGPARVRIEGDDGEIREGLSDGAGRISFAPMTTERVKVTFLDNRRLQPIQLTDLVIPGVEPMPDVRGADLELRCGLGPKLRIGGKTVRTKAAGTFGDLLAGRPVRFAACDPVPLKAGENRLTGVPLDTYRIETVIADGDAARAPRSTAKPAPVEVASWESGSREVRVDAAAASFLTVQENFNEGWRATVDGTELRPVRLDGWKQGWLVPAGTRGAVELTYEPDRAQLVSVAGGLGLLVLLLAVAVRPFGRRRPPRGRAPAAVPAAGRGWPIWAALPFAAALGAWIGGVPGAAVTLAVAVVCGWARTRRLAALRAIASPWPVAVAMVAGTGCLAVGARWNLLGNPANPSGVLGDVAPQVLGLVIVGRLAIELWRPRPPRGGSGRSGGGPISVSWDAPGGATPGSAAAPPAPDVPPGRSSTPPLRWTPRPAPEDP